MPAPSSRAVRASLALLLAACGGGGSSSGSGTGGGNENVVAIGVNGAPCTPASNYPNKACVQVTICAPGTTACVTVGDVLVDTGSFGLRVFKQALSGLALPQVTVGGGQVGTCVQFADQTSDWGPVQIADVVLGQEPPVRVPIHVVDATFGAPPASCPGPEASPAAAGLNGILGVGAFVEDCGPGCAQTAANGVYFACQSGACTGTAMPLDQQIQNPVALLPQDNNGVVIQLPAVGPTGAASVSGSLILGVGTRANNAMNGATTFPTNPATGTFTTTLEGTSFGRSFLDTGSNGLFFASPPALSLPRCPAPNAVWFCPSPTVSLTATNTGDGGSPSLPVPFQLGDFDTLTRSGQAVFSNLGGTSVADGSFDWGLPFHLGRRVAVGIEGRSSPLGTGPLVAY